MTASKVAVFPAPIVTRASSIVPREVEHLWPNVLYIGKPTLLVGDPGLGKSMVTIDIAARASRGSTWPLGSANPKARDVLLCSAEDDAGDTVVPRLIASGADLDRIEFLDGVMEEGHNHGQPHLAALSLDRHMDQIETIARRKKGELGLLVVDPISAFMGTADGHSNTEVRAVIARLAQVASNHRFSVLVVSHLNKGKDASAVYRVSGSLAFVAAARAVFVVVRSPEDPERRLVLPVKNNLAPDVCGFSYGIKVNDDGRPYVNWSDEAVSESTADQVLASAAKTPRQEAISARVREVIDWLKAALADEAQPASSMWRQSVERGFSKRDVRRAQQELGILQHPKGYRGDWHWELPR